MTCPSKTMMAILLEIRMDLKFKRYYWKLMKFTRQYWNETENTSIKQTTLHLVEEQKNTILYDLTGYTSMSVVAKDIVAITFMEKYSNNVEMLPKTEQVIWEMPMPEEIKVLGKKIVCEISEEAFISGFKGWRESTSTSPSGHHLGHYKAIVSDPDLKLQKPEDLTSPKA